MEQQLDPCMYQKQESLPFKYFEFVHNFDNSEQSQKYWP